MLLQEHLQLAGVTRDELFTSDVTRRAITFHDLRATGITWSAVRGDDPLRIKQRAGHRSFSTTEGYIREAENLREASANPFRPYRPRSRRFRLGFRHFGVVRRAGEPIFPGTGWSNGGSNSA